MVQKIIDTITTNKTFALITHFDPDADGLGACNALALALKKLGKKAYIFCDGKIPYNCQMLKVKLEEDRAKFAKADVAIAIDLNSLSRMKSYQAEYSQVATTIMLDHHKKENGSIAQMEISEPMTASACEIVYKLILQLGVKIDKDIALNLYAGIATDTGGFRYGNSLPKAHVAASELISYGFDLNHVNFNFFKKKEPGYDKLIKIGSKNLHIVSKKLAYIVIGYRDYSRVLNGIDTDCLHDVFAGISEDVFVKVIEKEKGLFAISLRSIDTDVSKVALMLSGGGHKCAAGGRLPGKKKDVIRAILSAMPEGIVG